MKIKRNEKKFFEKYGIIKLEIKIPKRKINLFKNDIINLIGDNGNDIYKYYEKKQLFRIENFFYKKNQISNFLQSGYFEKILYAFFKKKFVLFKEKINLKPPGAKKDFLHQDVQAGWLKYSKEFVSFVVSIDESSLNNSNLIFDFSGNNSKKIIGKKFKKLKVKDLKKPHFKDIPLKIGEIAMFNGYVPHMSKKNLSKKHRKQMYITYCVPLYKNIRKKYYKDKLKNFPPNSMRSKNKLYSYKI